MRLIKDCKEIIVVYIIQLLLIIFSSFICSLFKYDIELFMFSHYYYIVVFLYVILSIYFIKKYGDKEKISSIGNYFISIYFILSLSIVLNMLFYLLGIQYKSDNNFNIILLIISSGFLGPIVEEFLFRKILLTRLMVRHSIKSAVILESLIFALFHTSINGFIYAFVIGVCLSMFYIKHKNIKIPIICHMISNIFVLFLNGFNIYILVLSLICLFISIIIIYKMN